MHNTTPKDAHKSAETHSNRPLNNVSREELARNIFSPHDLHYVQLAPQYFENVITLGNYVHGDNYLTPELMTDYYTRSFHNNVNASWLALHDGVVVGFRLTFAHTQWTPDKWCSTNLWTVHKDKVCYFKCNTVAPSKQGLGIGSKLLAKSIESASMQGAVAGLAHIWLASPGNSAFNYFSKNGGVLIKKHSNKWQHASIYEGYDCPVCDKHCYCEGAEMLLPFS
ncbi:GNAT family N-acetyltransferase [Alteromonas sp. A081]|uniref:GNAT family N-acetyltransferase n=1 Tax=Alteromonas sp. A081 TaxID=3410269 RepID=UPI003B97EDEF